MLKDLSLVERLCFIQSALSVEKKRLNAFYRYHYRNAEDIMAALKPLLRKYAVCLVISHELQVCCDRPFLKVLLQLRSPQDAIQTHYILQLPEPKNGQDMCQAFGASISYANKYALASLFLVDDGVDQDVLHAPHKNITLYATQKSVCDQSSQEVMTPC